MQVRTGLIMALCTAGLASCASGHPSGKAPAVALGLSANERDAITRADGACDRASTSAVTDPSNHCFINQGGRAAN